VEASDWVERQIRGDCLAKSQRNEDVKGDVILI
jgi:hypothetical protein